MSKNNVKKINSKGNKKAEDKQLMIDELEEKLIAMAVDRDAKCKAAKEQLVSMLEVTADKYRTATGTAEALRIIRFVMGKENEGQIVSACKLAHRMAEEVMKMVDKAKSLDYIEMDQLCDGFYEKDFYDNGDLEFELMRIDLCRNVGEAAEDMVEFCKRIDIDIDDTKAELAKLKEEK